MVGKHSVRGVLTGEELDVRGTYSKRLKSHDRKHPHSAYNVVLVNDTWFRSAPNFRQHVNDGRSWASEELARIEKDMMAHNVGMPRVMVSMPSYNQLRTNVVAIDGARRNRIATSYIDENGNQRVKVRNV